MSGFSRRAVLQGGAAGSLVLAMPKTVAQAAAPRFSRGMNLHNVLNWPASTRQGGEISYTWPPFKAARFQMQPNEISGLRDLGFDFVRITIDPGLLITALPARAEEMAAILRAMLERYLKAGLGVVADLHPISLNPRFAPAALADGAGAAFSAYAGMVGEVARWLAPLAGENVALELMNEPILGGDAGFARWQGMMERLHAEARRASPDLALVLTGGEWSSARALMRLDPAPFARSNVLYTFHYYEPHSFTHQGVGGLAARYLSELAWPGRPAHFEGAFARAMQRIDADRTLSPPQRDAAINTTRKLLDDYTRTEHDEKRIVADFGAVKKWGADHGIAPSRILLGEFGTVRPRGQLPIIANGLHWLTTVRNAAQAQGFGWAFWVYRGYGGMAASEDRPGAALDAEIRAVLGVR